MSDTDAFDIHDLLNVIERELFGLDMKRADCVLYGGDLRKAKRDHEAMARVWDAVPLAARKEHERRNRKARADNLRRQADQIERGSDV